MSTVAINRDVLSWALDRAKPTMTKLQRKFPNISKWLSGESQPTMRQLESLARSTTTPLGFFFLEKPPQDRLPIQNFRTIRDETPSRPSPDLLETVHLMQQRQIWMREFLIEQGQEKLPFVSSARVDEPSTSIAHRLHQILGFDERWASRQPTWSDALGVLREAMSNAGILVVVNGIVGNNTRRKLDPEEFRGFVLVDEFAPLVFVNGADGKAAQMFTLAHELAHVIFGSSAAFDLREMLPADDPMEKACNRVAAEFLVPERQLYIVWPSIQHHLRPFQVLARQFKVSELVTARRALDLNLINKARFLDYYNEYQSHDRRVEASRPPGGDFYANQNFRVGQRFASVVIRAAKERKILYSEAYQLTGLYGKTFDQYASLLGIGGFS